jgi:osmotically inducible protein OsmC
MADIARKATAVWNGTLREGNGSLTTGSQTLNSTPYAFVSRFEEGQGTNPEELLAAALAGCYSMALAAGLSRKEYVVHHIQTEATAYLTPQQPSGYKITRFHLVTRGKVIDITAEDFAENAASTAKTCIVSQALAAVEITNEAILE